MTTRVERLHARRRERRLTMLSVALGVPSLVGVAGLVSAWVLMPPAPTTAPYEPPAATSSVAAASAQGGALDADSAALQQPDEDSAADATTPATARDDGAQAATSGRFVVGAVGLDVPLEQQAYEPTLIPAGYTSAYEATGSGWGGDAQPRLITLHSCSARTDCPGNALTQEGRATVEVGGEISVDGRIYRIEQVEIRAKDAIATSPAWDDLTSASLVVVTCSPDGNSRSVSNLILRAEEVVTG